ncbi:YceG-like family [Bifidobacterium sp. DSM 109958]|uniref:Endolytic murein transglycosylase n=1 Tax=Bifidobacterium moraviense TaxID=2675323 RepID=A0A7Y0F079_9BIFI|nr:endolytic transglycosylase MltG [Bifidobacterium sp. DSM 109958]NMM99608.1 YceG-like family [Bifidobacterium sp. DSM 109958]
MADDLQDFFAEHSHWEGQGGETHATAMPPAPPKSRKEMRRRRTIARRRGLVRLVVVLVVLAMAATCGWFVYDKAKGLSGLFGQNGSSVSSDYAGPGEGSVTFTVEEGQGSAKIAQGLADAGIVKTAGAFTQAVANAGNPVLYPGTFELQLRMKASDVVTVLSDPSKVGGYLEVRSGERVSEVIASAVQLSGLAQSDFDAVINSGGAGILPDEAGGHFEGWFEPGRYAVRNKSAQDIVKAMVDKRIAKLDSLGVPAGADRQRTVIIASIAEAEVNKAEYYGKVSRVIENRLAQNMPLGMDTTVAYGLGIKADQLTNAQLSDASNAYNTRINRGLPPTPISNPGDNAIQAAMNPEAGDWLFFVTTNLSTGETKFTTGTLAEQTAQFQQYVQEYKTSNPSAN